MAEIHTAHGRVQVELGTEARETLTETRPREASIDRLLEAERLLEGLDRETLGVFRTRFRAIGWARDVDPCMREAAHSFVGAIDSIAEGRSGLDELADAGRFLREDGTVLLKAMVLGTELRRVNDQARKGEQ